MVRGRISIKNILLVALVIGTISFPIVNRIPFYQHVMIMVLVYAAMAVGWNILSGYCGQISLGHASFFGIGAYTSTLLLQKLGFSPWLGMIGGMIMATAVAVVIGYSCFRLSGHYFAIATIAIGQILMMGMINWDWVGGATGLYIPVIPNSWINLQFQSKLPYYYIVLGILSIILLCTFIMERSKLGYYFKAIKSDPIAAQSLGINLVKYKLIAMIMSAVICSIAGAFYAQYVLFIDPESSFALSMSVIICIIAVLGGVGTFWGPVIGSFVLIPVSEFVRTYLGGGGRAIDMIIYGMAILLIAVFQPSGLVGLIKKLQIK